ncbi:MAG: chemotaxis protein CheX [Acidimicrobiales bacterium]
MMLDSEIEDIVKTIWETLVDVPIDRGTSDGPGDDSTVTGIVNIEGAWHGAVLVRCPLALASVVTAAMFQSEHDPTTDEIRDAVGELTNMVAGNVKSLLPAPSVISLPTVAFGKHYEISVVGTHTVIAVSFMSESHPLVVSVVQHSADIDGHGR